MLKAFIAEWNAARAVNRKLTDHRNTRNANQIVHTVSYEFTFRDQNIVNTVCEVEDKKRNEVKTIENIFFFSQSGRILANNVSHTGRYGEANMARDILAALAADGTHDQLLQERKMSKLNHYRESERNYIQQRLTESLFTDEEQEQLLEICDHFTSNLPKEAIDIIVSQSFSLHQGTNLYPLELFYQQLVTLLRQVKKTEQGERYLSRFSCDRWFYAPLPEATANRYPAISSCRHTFAELLDECKKHRSLKRSKNLEHDAMRIFLNLLTILQQFYWEITGKSPQMIYQAMQQRRLAKRKPAQRETNNLCSLAEIFAEQQDKLQSLPVFEDVPVFAE